LLSSGPGLGLEDPRGHLMKVLALALALARPRPRLFPQDPGNVVAVHVYALLTLTVSHDSLPLLV